MKGQKKSKNKRANQKRWADSKKRKEGEQLQNKLHRRREQEAAKRFKRQDAEIAKELSECNDEEIYDMLDEDNYYYYKKHDTTLFSLTDEELEAELARTTEEVLSLYSCGPVDKNAVPATQWLAELQLEAQRRRES